MQLVPFGTVARRPDPGRSPACGRSVAAQATPFGAGGGSCGMCHPGALKWVSVRQVFLPGLPLGESGVARAKARVSAGPQPRTAAASAKRAWRGPTL